MKKTEVKKNIAELAIKYKKIAIKEDKLGNWTTATSYYTACNGLVELARILGETVDDNGALVNSVYDAIEKSIKE